MPVWLKYKQLLEKTDQPSQFCKEAFRVEKKNNKKTQTTQAKNSIQTSQYQLERTSQANVFGL